jgi:hypothetical protein
MESPEKEKVMANPEIDNYCPPEKPENLALKLMRKPFEAHQISKMCKPTKRDNPPGKCSACGGWHKLPSVQLSYVGHAALTDRLLDADPHWSWEPMALSPTGTPLLDGDGGMWIKLTVAGVTRLGYGDAQGKTGGDAMKERIGDALRNAAMRFGAALDLWHKGDLHLVDEEPSLTFQKSPDNKTFTKQEPAPRGRPPKSASVQGTNAPALPAEPVVGKATAFNFGNNQEQVVTNLSGVHTGLLVPDSSSGNGPSAVKPSASVEEAPANTPQESQAASAGANIHGLDVSENDLPAFGPNHEPEKPATKDQQVTIVKPRVHKLLPDEKDRDKLIQYLKKRFKVSSASMLSMKQWEVVFADLEKDRGIIG